MTSTTVTMQTTFKRAAQLGQIFNSFKLKVKTDFGYQYDQSLNWRSLHPQRKRLFGSITNFKDYIYVFCI